MESLNIEGGKKNPQVAFEPYSGVMVMSGKSSLENPAKFYDPIVEWLGEYGKQPSPKTIFRMKLEYFNSSSSKLMMKIFRTLESMHKGEKTQCTIEWYYDEMDGSMLEAGEDFESMLKMDFEYIPHE